MDMEEVVGILDNLRKDQNEINVLETNKLKKWMMRSRNKIQSKLKTLDGNSSFVCSLAKIRWHLMGDAFADSYIEFVQNLVSVCPETSMVFVDETVASMNHIEAEKIQIREWEGPQHNFKLRGLRIDVRECHTRCHRLLKCIIDIVPNAGILMIDSIKTHFPAKQKPLVEHTTFVGNIIYLLDYLPYLRSYILEILIHHIMQIDQEIPLQEDIENEQGRNSKLHVIRDVFLEKMDNMLSMVLTELKGVFLCDMFSETVKRSFYEEILWTFQKIVIPTIKPKFTHIIVCVISQIKQEYSELLMGLLCNNIFNIFVTENQKVKMVRSRQKLAGSSSLLDVVRLNSIAYATSYIIEIADHKTREFTLDLFLAWLENYVEYNEHTWDNTGLENYRTHPVFYSIFASVMKILAAKFEEITQNTHLMESIRGIASSKLNPLGALDKKTSIILCKCLENTQKTSQTLQELYSAIKQERESPSAEHIIHSDFVKAWNDYSPFSFNANTLPLTMKLL